MAIHRENLHLLLHGKIKDSTILYITLLLLYLSSIMLTTLLVNACHLPMRGDKSKRIFFMFSYELRQRKHMKVSVSTLVILFILIWSSVVSHSLDVKAASPTL